MKFSSVVVSPDARLVLVFPPDDDDSGIVECARAILAHCQHGRMRRAIEQNPLVIMSLHLDNLYISEWNCCSLCSVSTCL